MEWIKCTDKLPPEETKMNTLYFDVWANGYRVVDAKFYDGAFYEQIDDCDGDYSHDEAIKMVSHWLLVEPPKH